MTFRDFDSRRTPRWGGTYLLVWSVLFAVNIVPSSASEPSRKLAPRQIITPAVNVPSSQKPSQSATPSRITKPEVRRTQPESPLIDAEGRLCTPNGICLVALVREGKQRPVSLQHRATYLGKNYYFSSAAAVQEFESAPSAFLPAHGGFDVCIVHRRGELVRGRLEHAQWYAQKLYLFESEATQAEAIRLGLLGDAAARDLSSQIRLAHQQESPEDAPADQAETTQTENELRPQSPERQSPDKTETDSNDNSLSTSAPEPVTRPYPVTRSSPEPRRFPDTDVTSTRPVRSSVPIESNRSATHIQTRAPTEVTSAVQATKAVQQPLPRNPQAERYWCRVYVRSTTPQSRRDVTIKLTFPPQEHIVAGRGPTKCHKKGQSIKFEPVPELHLGEREYFEVLIDAHHTDHGKLIVDIDEKNRITTNSSGRGWQVDVEYIPTKSEHADGNRF